MIEVLFGKGFLGTNAPFVSDLSLVLMLVTAGLLTYGRHLARQRRFKEHGRIQTVAVVVSTVVALVFMLYSFLKHILPGVPAKLLEGDYGVSTLHALVGSAAVLLGVFVVLRGHNLLPQALRFKNYKPFMQSAYTMYVLATVLGITVYVLVFVFGI